MVVYVKAGDNIAQGAVYRVKRTGPSAEPCGSPYESVTLSDKFSLFFTDWCLVFKLDEN